MGEVWRVGMSRCVNEDHATLLKLQQQDSQANTLRAGAHSFLTERPEFALDGNFQPSPVQLMERGRGVELVTCANHGCCT